MTKTEQAEEISDADDKAHAAHAELSQAVKLVREHRENAMSYLNLHCSKEGKLEITDSATDWRCARQLLNVALAETEKAQKAAFDLHEAMKILSAVVARFPQ